MPATLGLPRRAVLGGLVGLAGAVLAIGCEGERRATPPAGHRVVSISPSTTEAVFAIGAGGSLVGRSRHCDHPPEARRLPAVGGYADPSVEAIVALSPTLVVGARGPAGPALEQALNAHAIRTFFPETESLAQIEAMIVQLARLLDRPEAGERVAAEVRTARDAVAASVAGRPRVRVLFLFDIAPVVAAGPGSFADELVRVAGGENVVTRGGAYPTLGLEQVLALDPNVILDASEGAREGGAPGGLLASPSAPGWREVRAVATRAVRPLDTSIVLRPGPRIGEGLAVVARALHGEPGAPVAAPAPRGSSGP